MTFRPSDDVLDELVSGQNNNSVSQYDVEKQEDNQIVFGNHENQSFENVNISDNLQKNGVDLNVINIESEEVKAPDLSELLKDGGNDEITQELNNVENNLQKSDDVVNTTQELNNIESTLQESSNVGDTSQENNGLKHDENISKISGDEKNKTQQEVIPQQSDGLKDDEKENIGIKQVKNNNTIIQSKELSSSDNLLDEDRMRLVSSLDGSVNSNLDYLVDKNLVGIIEKYKNIHYLFFRWGYFILAVIIGILGGVLLQVKANTPDSFEMINDSSIQNIGRWIEETSDKKLSVLSGSDIDIVALVPYGAVSIDGDLFSSKSNLIKYNGVVLPQLSFINFNSGEIVSLENFDAKTLTRNDIENLVVELITDDSNYKNTTNLPSVGDVRWIPNTFQGGLYNGFNLKCLNSNKISDFVCDKFLDNFYLYGKYYNLSEDSSEFAELIRNIKKQGKDIEPLCKMIKDYTLRSGLTSDVMFSMMENCGVNDYMYYKKLVNFIDLENSLGQPELSDKVFDDPDLNAYKLLSAQQNVYKILDGTSINESYIKSYLKYVQNVLDKDKGSNRYLHPIYKDLLYVFNVDELSQKLMKKGKLSSDLKQMIDQINNGSPLYGSVSLISQLTTSDIIKVETGIVVDTKERTLEDLFSQYYAMTDRLRIRKADFVSDTEIKVQTEMFTDNIMGATNGETLKVTIDLYRQDNLLYVNTIKVANQPNFTDILGIYALEGNITFYAMLNYIDEQVGMWYDLEPEEIKEQPTFCENIMERSDISVYDCDDKIISLYKGEIEYTFELEDGVLDSFEISDENLDKKLKDKLDGVMFMKDDTPGIITSILDYTIESGEDNIENKLEVFNQFRIHFKLVPNDIHDIDGEPNKFLVDFTLGDFELQGYYDIDTHLLTRISFTKCSKPLEIRQLSLEITAENESQLIEILNNPKVFFARISPSVYKKYQKVCGG